MNVFGVGALVLTIVAILFFMQQSSTAKPSPTVLIGTTEIQVEVADTQSERVQGLSGHAPLKEGEGMLFVFEEEGNWGIWMKDMQFSLDIIWAASDGTIITIASNVSPDTYPQVFYPAEPRATYVLEVPAGFAGRRGIAEGAKLVVQ